MSTPPPEDDGEQSGQEPEGEATAKPRPGRPPKWPKERRIPPITKGRMSFQPGDEHPMDAQLDEARRLRDEIVEQLAQVQALVIELSELDDASTVISREEKEVEALLWDLYNGMKHRDHIVATFIVARRRRMLQRFQAAQAALEQARDFLQADEALLPMLQQTISEAQAAALALHGPPPSYPEIADEGQEDQADEEPEESKAVEVPIPSEEDQADDEETQAARRSLMAQAGGGDDALATRAALAALEQRAKTMRNAITSGAGWFEWFFIPRSKARRYTAGAREFLKREEPIPPDVQIYEEVQDTRPYGPYLRYRWYEGGTKKKPVKYSMGMGLISFKWYRLRSPNSRNEPPKL